MSINNVTVATNTIQTVITVDDSIVQVTNVVHSPIVSAAQGPQGIQGASAATALPGLTDVDMSTGLTDGALLVYNEQVSKWKPTRVLEKQAVECGQY